MALFLDKWGDIRGKVADLVFSANAGGAYIRSKVTPMNPMTAKQMAARARLAQFSGQYSTGLTPEEREGWQQLANTVPYTNIFGQSKYLNGLSMFVKVNSLLAAIGQTPLVTAPNNLQVRPIAVAVTSAPTTAGQEWSISVTPTVSATEAIIIYNTPCINPAISFVKNLYRLNANIALGVQVNPFEIEWDTSIGVLTVGQTTHARICRVNLETGGVTLGVPVVSTIAS